MSIADIARRVGKLAADNSPTILTSVGVVGTITTAYLAAKASFRVAKKLDHEEWDASTGKEKIQIIRETGIWKDYIPTAVSTVTTVVCVISANRIGGKKAAALAGAMGVLEKTVDDYKAKVVKEIGQRKDDKIHAEIAQDRVNANPPDEHVIEEVKLLSAPDRQLCLDLYGNQYFTGSVEKIRRAINDFNHMLNTDGFGSLADLYRMLELPTVPTWSETVGWNQDRLVEERIDSTLVGESLPCITLSFRNEPHGDYGRPFLSRY